jgi:hypothetical protein
MQVHRRGKRLEVTASLSADVREVILDIHSSRNDVISRFSDEAPAAKMTGILSPEIDNSRIEKDIWFPVVDIAIDKTAEGVLAFDPEAEDGSAEFSINGVSHQEMYPVTDEAFILAEFLEYWENSVFIDGALSPLRGFSLRWRLDAQGSAFKHTLDLLSTQWSGRVTLSVVLADNSVSEVGTAIVENEPAAPTIPHAGAGLEPERIIASLNATLDCLKRR